MSKTEILRGYRSFSEVLSRRAFVQAADIRCYYVIHREIPPCICAVGFAVKRQRRAVRRNAARRFLRESYRLHKHALAATCTSLHVGVKCVIMYSAPQKKENVEFRAVEETMKLLISSLVERLNSECLSC
ncbi:MAG: ribonuclease P protein component [Ignavibacteria bacterium]|nr:ribonuclease P protein component [Ignavibacteria bacterium]